MIEIVPEAFHSIMTFETALPKHYLMLYHERHIFEDVTFTTGQFIELGNILSMTISAQERFLLSRMLVTV